MFIRSKRLFLRPGWPEDWQDLFALIRDQEIVRNLSDAPWPYTADHARELAGKVQETGLPHFFVTLPSASGAKLIGCAGLGRFHGDIELGYWVARDHWGKGYATESARAVLSVARALGHRRIVAGHFHDNPASGRVLSKAGFVPTGHDARRFCRSRGEHLASVRYAVELDGGAGGDAGGEDGMPPRLAA